MLGGGLGPVTVGITSSGTVNLGRMLQASEAWPINFGFLGKGSAYDVEPLLEQGRAGRDRAEDPRGLGRDAGGRSDASLRAGDELDMQVQIHTDTLNESGFYEDTIARDRRPHDPHLPLRGRGRRSRAGHHPGGRRGELPALVDQPHEPVHRQHVRRAPRHGDGLPSPQPARARGRGVRRVADPPRDDRGRGRAARPGRDQRARLRLAGHGPHRRDDRAHLAARVQDEGRSAARCPRTRAAATTTTASSATSRS